MRIFEVICSGTPLVTDYLEDIEEIGLGKYITYYNHDSEIENKINCVLENLKEKNELAIKAKNEVCSLHSYEVRVNKIIDFCANENHFKHKLRFPLNILQKTQFIRKYFMSRYLNLVILFLVDNQYFRFLLNKKLRGE